MTYITQLKGRKAMLSSRILTMILAGFVLVVLQSSKVQAQQWTTTGTNISNSNAGNVGVGTTTSTPTERLTVLVSDAVSNGVTQVLSIGHTTTGTPSAGLGSGFTFRAKRSDGSMGNIGHIAGIWEDPTNGTEDGALVFAPTLNSTGFGTERMRVSSSGNVGIGTTNPLGRLHTVASGASNFLYIDAYGTGNMPLIYSRVARGSATAPTALASGALVYDSRSLGYDGAAFQNVSIIRTAVDGTVSAGIVPGRIQFYTTNASGTLTEAMRIDKSGNVGIGTATPLYSLDVNGGTNSFRAKASTSSSNDTIATFESAGGIQAIVRANGYVGIGTTSPQNPLDVNGSRSHCPVGIEQS